MPGGLRTEIHLGADSTDGAFCVLVDHPPPGWSLPPHRHLREAETIHVIEGQIAMEIGGQPRRVSAGQTVHVPRGTVHSGRNDGPTTARRLILFSPAGAERFFLEVGAGTPDADIDLSTVAAAATRYGWEFA
jgi:quercetin dioxygenase-like cupin family protein